MGSQDGLLHNSLPKLIPSNEDACCICGAKHRSLKRKALATGLLSIRVEEVLLDPNDSTRAEALRQKLAQGGSTHVFLCKNDHVANGKAKTQAALQHMAQEQKHGMQTRGVVAQIKEVPGWLRCRAGQLFHVRSKAEKAVVLQTIAQEEANTEAILSEEEGAMVTRQRYRDRGQPTSTQEPCMEPGPSATHAVSQSSSSNVVRNLFSARFSVTTWEPSSGFSPEQQTLSSLEMMGKQRDVTCNPRRRKASCKRMPSCRRVLSCLPKKCSFHKIPSPTFHARITNTGPEKGF